MLVLAAFLAGSFNICFLHTEDALALGGKMDPESFDICPKADGPTKDGETGQQNFLYCYFSHVQAKKEAPDSEKGCYEFTFLESEDEPPCISQIFYFKDSFDFFAYEDLSLLSVFKKE